MSKYKDLSFPELIKKLEECIETSDMFMKAGDKNMGLAWLEQGEFVYKEMRKRGFRWKHFK